MDLELPTPPDLRKCINKLINTDELIDLVRDRPVIWDKTVEGYRNKELSNSAWEEICKAIFDTYDAWGVEQKLFVAKLVKQKWTAARDIWQRNYKKRKEAIQNGENCNDIKDNPRYDKLRFLAKVYDVDNFHSGNEEKVLNKNLENLESPASPTGDQDVENIFNLDNNMQKNILQYFMTHKKFQKAPNINPQIKKTESTSPIINKQTNHDQGSSHKTVVVDFDNRFNVSSLMKATKHRTSSVDSRETGKTMLSNMQPTKSDKTAGGLGKTEVNSPLSNKKSGTETCLQEEETMPFVCLKKEEDEVSTPCASTNNNISDVKNCGVKRKLSETEFETPTKKTVNSENSSSIQLENFIQLFLKPRIEDFTKSQIMDFFCEILKPLIKDKHQLLDFQIETLQLIKKTEGSFKDKDC